MPTVCYGTPGTYSVTLTVTNAGGSDTATDSAAVVVDICSGITHATPLEQIGLWPNPVQRMLHLELPGSGAITVLDAQGRTVLKAKSAGKEHVLDTSELPAGNYVLRYSGEGKSLSRIFVKQ